MGYANASGLQDMDGSWGRSDDAAFALLARDSQSPYSDSAKTLDGGAIKRSLPATLVAVPGMNAMAAERLWTTPLAHTVAPTRPPSAWQRAL